MITNIKQGNGLDVEENEQVSEVEKKEVRGLVYEGYLLWQKLLEIQERAKELGLSLLVIENLSYGAVAASPITEERNGRKYIVGTDIPVISTKIGSSQCHNNEYYLRKDLFTEEELRYILTEKPLIVVVDASTSVSDPNRTSPHIPDGFKGYRNALKKEIGQGRFYYFL